MPTALVALANDAQLSEAERDDRIRSKLKGLAPDHTATNIRRVGIIVRHGVELTVYDADLLAP